MDTQSINIKPLDKRIEDIPGALIVAKATESQLPQWITTNRKNLAEKLTLSYYQFTYNIHLLANKHKLVIKDCIPNIKNLLPKYDD